MFVVGSLGVLALCADVSSQCNYDVTVLDYPIDCSIGTVITRGIGMNEQGAVVGEYKCSIWTTTEAFLWTPEGGFSTLRRPPGVTSASAVDINEQGVICGTMIVGGLGCRGFVYENGEWTELPPVLPESGWSMAWAISDSGLVVGERAIGDDVWPRNAFTWSRAVGFADLGIMSGPGSSAADLTESGILVGWTGNGGSVSDTFIWEDGRLTFLGPIPAGYTSEAHAISENGLIVGRGRMQMEGFSAGIVRAFVWKNGVYTNLGTLPNHIYSAALDVNDLGQAAGASWLVDGINIFHATLWQNGLMTDLNRLISSSLNINITSAWRVGEDGTILTRANNSETAILTPIDPPVGDLDLDCRVGIIDFLRLLADWGPCPATTDCLADLNGDGVVDSLDFAMLFENWG
jgi:probable HAF family extracellular repeat protein